MRGHTQAYAISVDDKAETAKKLAEKLTIGGLKSEIEILNEKCTMIKVFGTENNIEIASSIYFFVEKDLTDLSELFWRLGDKLCGTIIDNFDVSQLITDNVTNMDRMFSGMQAYMLDLSCLNTSKLESVVSMFFESHIVLLRLNGLDISRCTSTRKMFAHFTGSIKGLEQLDTSNVTDMQEMFQDVELTEEPEVNELATVNIGEFNTSKVTNMQGLFRNAKLKLVDFRGIDTSHCNDMSGLLCLLLGRVEGIECLDTSNVTNMDHMFAGLGRRNYINYDFSRLNTSKVTSMVGMFDGVQYDGELNLNNFDTRNVVDMTLMFCELSAQKLNISKFNFSSTVLMAGFLTRSNIIEVVLPSFEKFRPRNGFEKLMNTDYLERIAIGGMFSHLTARRLSIRGIVIDQRNLAHDKIDQNGIMDGSAIQTLEILNCELLIDETDNPCCSVNEFNCNMPLKVITNSVMTAHLFAEKAPVSAFKNQIKLICKDCFGRIEVKNKVYSHDSKDKVGTVYECSCCHKKTVVIGKYNSSLLEDCMNKCTYRHRSNYCERLDTYLEWDKERLGK